MRRKSVSVVLLSTKFVFIANNIFFQLEHKNKTKISLLFPILAAYLRSNLQMKPVWLASDKKSSLSLLVNCYCVRKYWHNKSHGKETAVNCEVNWAASSVAKNQNNCNCAEAVSGCTALRHKPGEWFQTLCLHAGCFPNFQTFQGKAQTFGWGGKCPGGGAGTFVQVNVTAHIPPCILCTGI